jgi:hypothetical protein
MKGLAIVHVARQAALAECLTKVAGVRGEHDLTVIEPQPKGLVPLISVTSCKSAGSQFGCRNRTIR